MRIIITGASGFIGTNVLEYFSHRAEVINIDCVSPRNTDHLQYWKEVDINNREKVIEAFKAFSPDYIIHLAARTDLDGVSLEDYASNIEGVRNVLEAANFCPNLKKILITSSMLVCRVGYQPQNQRDYCPTTWYGKSKVQTEEIVWEHQPACDWAILRPTSMWGPWFAVPYRNFFDMIKKRMYVHIGHKSCTKTYGFIDNAVYQIERILLTDTKDPKHKVFYLGDSPATNIEDWANEIAREFGYRIIRIPYWLMKCAAYCGDLLGLLGVRFPMTSFRLKNMTTDNIINLEESYKVAPNPPVSRVDGIEKTLQWMQQN